MSEAIDHHLQSIKRMVTNSIEHSDNGIETVSKYIVSLEIRIKELEDSIPTIKREWYIMGSNDNFKALSDSGKLIL